MFLSVYVCFGSDVVIVLLIIVCGNFIELLILDKMEGVL